MLETSYYFSWYLVRAFEHAGLEDRYQGMLQTWRGLTALNFSTGPEQQGRSSRAVPALTVMPGAPIPRPT
ncbi:hypothetical protein [Asticcacaulis sp. AC402]|uniref:hypothetical protein n=1 Tax=Asticcacaulis sp. AC402 TaxID=1282361 RepID=UPI00138AB453|nr:hypothetical protein [Asticcacaulis sp. AC402]